MRIALATCESLPEPDFDEAPLLAAFGEAGHEAASVPWDGATGSPHAMGQFDVVCLRATWNYTEQPEAFLRWVEEVSRQTRVLNGARVVRWNLEKTYLRSLRERGVPVVPTEFVGSGASVDVARLVSREHWGGVVIKPVVGAGSFMTERFVGERLGEAQAFLDRHRVEREMMVQPYLSSVESDQTGELAIVVIEGEVSHGVRKRARFSVDDESVTPARVSEQACALAMQTLDAAATELGGEPLLYARVDVMTGDDDRLLLSELELVEPSLFFERGDGAAARFVRAVERIVG